MLRTIAGIFLSAVLLVLAFPKTGWWGLAWVALVPLMFVLEGKRYKSAFGWGFLCGFLFFFGTLGWFIYVTWPGAVLLVAYLAVYFGLFGLAFKFFQPLPLLPRMFVLAAAWALLEFIRANLFTGFGWAMLGHSQYQNIQFIQIADITGVYGISFLVMLVNILIFETVKHVMPECSYRASSPCARSPIKAFGDDNGVVRRAQLLTGGILFLVLAYGVWETVTPGDIPQVSVGVVQPNVQQLLKWNPAMQPWIVQNTIRLSQGLKQFQPDLIVWPETSLPGVISEEPELTGAIKLAAKQMHTPILMGAITVEPQDRYYNSAYLIAADGVIAERYDKIHLVPFGEYLPLRPILGWINRFVPLEDFTSGTQYTIMHAGKDKPFGVLICFEDTLSDVRRNFVKAGAKFFVNMTNDAWFMDTKAPFIHLQAAVFGCVENKRSLVRAANTGFSGFVDPWGRIVGAVEDAKHKRTFIEGSAFARIPVMSTITFYTKYGDVFTWICLFAILWAVYFRRKYV